MKPSEQQKPTYEELEKEVNMLAGHVGSDTARIIRLEEQLAEERRRVEELEKQLGEARVEVEKLKKSNPLNAHHFDVDEYYREEKPMTSEEKITSLEAQLTLCRVALKYIYDNIDDEDNPSTNSLKWIKDSCEKALTSKTQGEAG